MRTWSPKRQLPNPVAEDASGDQVIGEPAGRWTALALIAIAQIGAMSTWFSAAAVAPALARDWRLSATEVGFLTVAVQLGFVTGALTSGITGLADICSIRRVLIVSAVAAALANGLLILIDDDLWLAAILRFALGCCLAGVYPTSMKLMTGWFRAGRGLAFGTLIGALTLGAALPRLHALRTLRSAERAPRPALGRPLPPRSRDPASQRRLLWAHVGTVRHVDLGPHFPAGQLLRVPGER